MSKLDTFLFFPQPSCKFNSMILRNIAVCSVCWLFCIPIYSLHSFNLNNSNQHVRDVISVIYWRLNWLLILLSMSKEFVTFKLYSKLLFKLEYVNPCYPNISASTSFLNTCPLFTWWLKMFSCPLHDRLKDAFDKMYHFWDMTQNYP